MRLWGINTEPRSEVFVWDWILTYQNWSFVSIYSKQQKVPNCNKNERGLFFVWLHINKLTCIKGAWTHWKMADWKQNSPYSVNVHNYKTTTQNVLKAVWKILIQHLRDKKYCIWFCGYCLKLTVMMYCLMVSGPMVNLQEMCLLQNCHLEDKTVDVQTCCKRVPILNTGALTI